MIGRLRGDIIDKRPPWLLLDVNGVGYELEAPMSTFYDLPAVGETVTLVTHLAVREDAHTLYGFLREADRVLFRDLLKVTGVGARMALAILSGMDARRGWPGPRGVCDRGDGRERCGTEGGYCTGRFYHSSPRMEEVA